MNYLEYALSIFEPGKVHLIPVNEDKRPMCKWASFQEQQTEEDIKRIFSTPSWGIAMLTGVGNMEVIDIDSDDYDGPIPLHDDFFATISTFIEEDLAAATTKSGGMHVVYRCNEIEGNQKLARNEKGDVIIETRGKGGYIVIAPTPGYEWISCDPTMIPAISTETRESLVNVSRAYDQFVEPVVAPPVVTNTTPIQHPGLSTIDDYNQIHGWNHIVGMLQSNGWAIDRTNATHVYMRRPGKNKGHSADIHKEKNLLKVWSSNAHPFESETAYNAFQVYSMLNHKGDDKAAARDLYYKGYGDRTTVVEPVVLAEGVEEVDVSTIDEFEFNMFLVDRSGRSIPTAGPGSIIVITGDTGAGKSTIQDIMCMSAMNNHQFFGINIQAGEGKVVRFDTEQEAFWLKRGKKRILDSCNYTVNKSRLRYYAIEGLLKSSEKNEYAKSYVKDNPGISVVFIDNIVDLVGGVNDEDKSLTFVSEWKHLAKEYGFILVVTLHETRNTGYAQGWLGKILEQRAAWVIRMVKKGNEVGEYFVVETRKKRGEPLKEPIMFQRGRNGEINQFIPERKKQFNEYESI